MELGLGFLLGLMVGTGIVIIASIVLSVARKAAASQKAAEKTDKKAVKPNVDAEEAMRVQSSNVAQNNASSNAAEASSGIYETVVEELESRDAQLSQSIQEVRELVLQLAELVQSTGDASGQAEKVFTSAKTAIGAVDLAKPEKLAEARGVLVREIDRVLKSNASLHRELEKANEGIVEQRKQIEELRVQARIDGLTRIPNRADFDERLNEYIGLLERTNIPFCLLLLDIDHFKQVNDVHGHVNGDRILRGIAAKISNTIRTNDFAARYGGEEFAVLFPNTKLSEAATVADRVRQDIAKTNFRLDNQSIRITISGGLAECSSKGSKSEVFIAASDKALYQAKTGGRNRLIVAKNEDKP